ncbi:MAG: HEAT repeat domain-containing protein [Chloroflexi bacterium]|uniref:HEAT repeat domain-containing protein n=1 Tax=Candidatus Chlorohelix allophototropha TaxID=3003348 RepID=A0A8T7M9U9_9CHLR|nr:HEAT repeat domain-containing protein [Chloroflexota bacterium]WJW68753.1 HEAT repeat domain-containing protein [Chloroflexota bacterium L227-S17]
MIGDSNAFEALLNIMDDSAEDDEIKSASILALGKIGRGRAVKPLLTYIHIHNESKWQQVIVWALGETKDDGAIGFLLNSLKSEDAWLRMRSVSALGTIASPQVVGYLIEALKDESLVVRASAAKALSDLNEKKAVEPLILICQNRPINVEIVEALAKFEDITILPTLSWLYRNHSQESIRRVAWEKIKKLEVSQIML